MILVFGGTTEGRKAVEVLEEAGSSFFYSTKTGEQDLTLQHGTRIDGAMDAEAMESFIREHDIRLIVDAAHPFASTLHQTIAAVSEDCQIPFIRYERIYPPRDPDITWIDDYSQIPDDIHSLLATTGVQSISRLKYLEARGVQVYYRILPRESSVALAKEQGAKPEQLCYYEDSSVIDIDAEAILLKESGETGGFSEKVTAARAKGMRIIALKRPPLSIIHYPFSIVNGPYGLRRAVEHLLPEFYPLHSGLTTGTCATAAAVAATIRLAKGETPKEVPVILPNGETIQVPVTYGDDYASCFKEAGDDPDITNGIEVRAKVIASDKNGQTRTNLSCAEEVRDIPSQSVAIYGGEGVGTITLPGFDYPPGSPAINKAPREMIRQNLEKLCTSVSLCLETISVTISVPNGAEIAKKTFNPRLGIEGGISIIGVSGIVKPFSEEAFIDSIRKCMTIAQASGTDRVVINSGGKSERFVKALYPDLPRQAFVEYGNYIGETLKIAHELQFKNVTLGVMLGKAVKLAAGHLDTHSRKITMDIDFIQQMLQESGISIDISDITLARELWERIPSTQLDDFAHTVIRHCADYCNSLLPDGSLTILLIDDNGKIYSTTRSATQGDACYQRDARIKRIDMRYKDLFIDFDDTLYDTYGNAVIALQETYDAFRLDRYFDSPKTFYDAYWSANIDLWSRYSKGEIDRPFLIVERFRRPLSVGKGLDVTKDLCLEVSDKFLDFCSSKSGVVDGAHELMDYLKQKGYRMHMTSNGFHEVQYKKLAACGLRDHFDTIILSEDAGVNKPSSLYFDYALKTSGASRETTLMIGDNLQTDILGALNAGLDAMLVNRWKVDVSESPQSPTFVVNSLRDIMAIL